MQEHFFEDRIYYRTNEFKTDRLNLVFVHGVSGSSSAWWPYEKIFENDFNILNYDIRGHGMSKKYPKYEDYEIKNFVDDLNDLLTYLKISKFVLISNSFAALIHTEYLRTHRANVIANVFTSPEVFLNEGFFAKVMRGALTLLVSIIKIIPFNPKPRGHVEYSKHIGSTDWNISRNITDIKNTGIHAHFFTLLQSLTPKQEYELEKINVPTLIMHGEKDTMVPIKNSIRMSKEIKNSEFVPIYDVDHNTVHNGVKTMSKAIQTFISKNKLFSK